VKNILADFTLPKRWHVCLSLIVDGVPAEA